MEEKHARCAGLDVHRKLIVACVRLAEGSQVKREVRRLSMGGGKRGHPVKSALQAQISSPAALPRSCP
jgi:hypothetical protein